MTRQPELVFRTWGGKRAGAGRKRHTNELPHVARPELHSNHPQHVTIRVRPDVISLRRSKSFAAVKRALKTCREQFGARICQWVVLGNHLHILIEAEDRIALGRAIKGLNVRLAKELNRLMGRKGRVIADRYHVRALKTPTEVRNALLYLARNARKHGFTKSPLPDRYSSWVNLDLMAQPHTWLLRCGFKRAGPVAEMMCAASRQPVWFSSAPAPV